jgi:hypothetical protein
MPLDLTMGFVKQFFDSTILFSADSGRSPSVLKGCDGFLNATRESGDEIGGFSSSPLYIVVRNDDKTAQKPDIRC